MRKLNLLLYFLTIVVLLFTIFGCQQNNKSDSASNEVRIPGAYKALNLWNYTRAYPNEDIPNEGYGLAFDHHEKQFLKSTRNQNNGIEAMGPLNTTGRTLTIAVNPQAPNTIYAGSASGGLWRSRNLGLGISWEYVETGFPILGVSTIEFAPQDSMVMYIGTGEVYNYADTGTDGASRRTRGSYGFGILKSEDGGITWEKSLDWTYQQQRGVWMIKVSPLNPNIVYAATTNGIYKSIDAGGTWDLVFEKLMGTDIDIDPRDDNRLIAGFGNLGSEGRGLFYSNDGGSIWTQVGAHDDFQGKILIARDILQPDIIYASVGNGFGFSDGDTQLLKSEDGGLSFSMINRFDYSRWQGWFAHDIAVDPFNSDNLMAVGIGVHKSTDGGVNLNDEVSTGVTGGTPPIEGPDGPSDYVHSDNHFVMYHPTIEDLILIGSDGGVFLSFDNGINYRSANGGMQTTQFYNGFSVSHSDENFALGGLQDNSTVVFRGDAQWQRAAGGDGSWTAINQIDNDYVYASAQNLAIFRSTNNGRNFNERIALNLSGDSPLFISPYVISDSDPDILYAGAMNVYKSENRGDSWSITNGGAAVDEGNPIFAMDVHTEFSDIVYVATAPIVGSANVLSSFDGGETWQSGNTGLPDRVPNDIVMSNDNPDMAFVTFSGFGTQHLFRTTDRGQSWLAIDTDLPDVPGNAIAIDESTGIIYYGTDIAVYSAAYRDDAGELNDEPEWTLYNEGMPLAAITLDLKISPSNNKLWIITHGNGTYTGDLILGSSSTESISKEAQFTIGPNPATEQIFITKTDSELIDWKLRTVAGELLLNGNSKQIDVSSLISGTYLLEVRTSRGSGTKKVLIR